MPRTRTWVLTKPGNNIRSPTCSEPRSDGLSFPASSSAQSSRSEAQESYPVPRGQTVVGGDTWLIVGIVGSGDGAMRRLYKVEHGSRPRPTLPSDGSYFTAPHTSRA